jgi:hypothetical protein
MTEGYATGARLGNQKKSQSEPILGVSGCGRYNCRMIFCALVLAAVFCAASLFAEETPESIAESGLPSLLTTYKNVDQHPELSTREQRTSELIAKELKAATAWLCSCAPTWMRCQSRGKPTYCELASTPTEFNDIPRGAPSSSVARNSANACLLVE